MRRKSSLIYQRFLSTPSARRATSLLISSSRRVNISIHALREEGDITNMSKISNEEVISIHALREEGDVSASICTLEAKNFYPRPPRGGRHTVGGGACLVDGHFYPRPPRGGRQEQLTMI